MVPLTFYLDEGASLGLDAPCLTAGEASLSYGDVQQLSHCIAAALGQSGIQPGDKVAILSGNDAIAFSCVFGISRAGAVWCPINPRNEAGENRELLHLFDCSLLIFHGNYMSLVGQIAPDLPKLHTLVCLDRASDLGPSFERWSRLAEPVAGDQAPVDDVAMIVGTGVTTGRPKGVEIVIMAAPDVGVFVDLVERHRVTHTFLPPTLIYMLLGHPGLDDHDLSSVQTFWYGAAPMSAARLEEAPRRIGPMAQLFGQTEAPMMISTLSTADHYRADRSVATERLTSAGRPAPLVAVRIMDPAGELLPPGERGEIVIRSSLVMGGYDKNPAATAEASAFGWHHTGDIGYLDGDNFLYIVDRAKDMIIAGGFNVYSAEVENALTAHPDVRDCAVVGLADEKWGERVTAVIEARPGAVIDAAELTAFVKARIGSVKAPKQIELWPELPRSKVGKVLRSQIKAQLLQVGVQPRFRSDPSETQVSNRRRLR